EGPCLTPRPLKVLAQRLAAAVAPALRHFLLCRVSRCLDLLLPVDGFCYEEVPALHQRLKQTPAALVGLGVWPPQPVQVVRLISRVSRLSGTSLRSRSTRARR